MTKVIVESKKGVIFVSPNETGAVVQLVRIRACHARGRGFESRPHRQARFWIVARRRVFVCGGGLRSKLLFAKTQKRLYNNNYTDTSKYSAGNLFP